MGFRRRRNSTTRSVAMEAARRPQCSFFSSESMLRSGQRKQSWQLDKSSRQEALNPAQSQPKRSRSSRSSPSTSRGSFWSL